MKAPRARDATSARPVVSTLKKIVSKDRGKSASTRPRPCVPAASSHTGAAHGTDSTAATRRRYTHCRTPTDRQTDERERETEGAINARAKERDERINLLCDKDKYIKEELKLDRVRE